MSAEDNENFDKSELILEEGSVTYMRVLSKNYQILIKIIVTITKLLSKNVTKKLFVFFAS